MNAREHNEDGKALARAVRTALYRKKITIAKAAGLINVAEATLRTWLHRGHFSRPVIARLANLLGWEESADELAKKFGISWAQSRSSMNADEERISLEQVLDFQNRLCEKIDGFSSENTTGLCRCFEAMGEGDLFVFSSLSVMPLEFDRVRWQKFGRAVADGIANGGTCLYLFPHRDLIGEYSEEGIWNYDDMISDQAFQSGAQLFRKNVELHLTDKLDWTEGRAEEWVRERLIHHTYKESPFAVPGFAIGMFQTRRSTGNVIRRMTVRIPTDLGGVLFIPEVEREVFTLRFWKFIRETIKALISELPEQEKAILEKVDSMLKSEADAVLWRREFERR